MVAFEMKPKIWAGILLAFGSDQWDNNGNHCIFFTLVAIIFNIQCYSNHPLEWFVGWRQRKKNYDFHSLIRTKSQQNSGPGD